MYEAQYFDIHVQKLKPIVVESPLLCRIIYSEVRGSTFLRGNVPYSTRQLSFGRQFRTAHVGCRQNGLR